LCGHEAPTRVAAGTAKPMPYSATEARELIVRIADRPDLVSILGEWLWHEWWRDAGYTLEQTRSGVAASVSHSGPPQTFVLLADGKPVGTASLVAHDLDERPDLTPWLAGVFVIPEARGRGHVIHLIQAVEAACRSAGIPVVWLYTAGAERVYTRAGWWSVETVQRRSRRPVTLMRRDLISGLP
jgi:GNAT superfamily N-acetyltransferase